MFGKEFHQSIEVLIQSLRSIHKDYDTPSLSRSVGNSILSRFLGLYIRAFGIPEIGFQIRSLYFQNIISTHVSQSAIRNILDAGSGIGAYVFWLTKKFPKARVTGGEIDPKKLKHSMQLRTKLRASNATFTYMDITKAARGMTYDLIVTIDVLEHVPRYSAALHNFSKLLRPGGYLYIHMPQPHQRRILGSLREWRHDDHVREGISKKTLENTLKKLGYKVIISRETFGFFGKLAWELNHIMLAKSFILAGITFPFLYIIALLDLFWKNDNGLGVSVLTKK